MKVNRNRLLIASATVYIAAFALLYAIASCASILPAISEVSLSSALNTVGKRVQFSAETALWALLILSPLIIWRAKKENT